MKIIYLTVCMFTLLWIIIFLVYEDFRFVAFLQYIYKFLADDIKIELLQLNIRYKSLFFEDFGFIIVSRDRMDNLPQNAVLQLHIGETCHVLM